MTVEIRVRLLPYPEARLQPYLDLGGLFIWIGDPLERQSNGLGVGSGYAN